VYSLRETITFAEQRLLACYACLHFLLYWHFTFKISKGHFGPGLALVFDLRSMTLPEDQLARSSLPHLNCVYLLTQLPASSRFQGLSRIPRRRTFCGKHLLYLQKATNRMSSQTFSLLCLALSGTPGNQSITANRPRARCHPSLKISLSCSRQVFVWATCHNHHLPVRHHQLIVHSNCYRTAQVSDMTFAITQLLLVRLSNWCSCRSKILF
jgi:hypothetical protein